MRLDEQEFDPQSDILLDGGVYEAHFRDCIYRNCDDNMALAEARFRSEIPRSESEVCAALAVYGAQYALYLGSDCLRGSGRFHMQADVWAAVGKWTQRAMAVFRQEGERGET